MADEIHGFDWKGSPGRTLLLLAVVFCVAAVKVAWTLGGAAHARQALITMEAGTWPDVPLGMVLTEPLLASVLAVLLSRTGSAWLAARRAAAPHEHHPAPAKAALTGLAGTLAFGVLVATVHGWAWGLATWAVAYLLRLGVVATYDTAPGSRRFRAGRVSHRVALLLTVVVLPLVALAAALDGHAWSNVLECDVDTGHGPHRSRVVEFTAQSSGFIAWDLHAHEPVFGDNCALAPDQTARRPWWRT